MAPEAPRPSTTHATPSHPGSDAGLLGEHRGVAAVIDALDLPHVDLDPRPLDVLDRLAHQARAQLRVVAIAVAVDALELCLRGGHQQLEQEFPRGPAIRLLVQPVREALEAPELAGVQLRVVLRVVADEDLREIRIEPLDVRAELLAVIEVELVLTGLLDRHRELQPVLARPLRNVGAELLVDQHSRRARIHAAADGLEHALEDQPLRVGNRGGLLGRGSPSMPNIFF